MATLDPPFNGLTIGQHNLQVSFLGWHTVGTCTITVNDLFHFAVTGNSNSLSGPCTVTNGGETLSGTYTRNGSSLSSADKDHSVTAWPENSSLVVKVSGVKVRITA